MDKSLSLLLQLVLAMVTLVLSTHGFKCQSDPEGIPSVISVKPIDNSIKFLIRNLNFIRGTSPVGVSFTDSLNFVSPGNNTLVTYRLLFWDEQTCTPSNQGGTKVQNALISGAFQEMYTSFWGDGQEGSRFGWGTLVSKNLIVDYYTISPLHPLVLDFQSKDRAGLVCSKDENTAPACNPRTSNLINGNNGVFNALRAGESLTSPNGMYKLAVEDRSCKLVVTDKSNNDLWEMSGNTTTSEFDGCYLELRPDLNLVLTGKSGASVFVLWESYPTSKLADNPSLVRRHATGVLTMQNDGNVVIFATDTDVVPIWSRF